MREDLGRNDICFYANNRDNIVAENALKKGSWVEGSLFIR